MKGSEQDKDKTVNFLKKQYCKRLYGYLEYHNILFSLQFVFRKKYSTNNNNFNNNNNNYYYYKYYYPLMSFTEFICHSIDNNKYGCGVFIDSNEGF